MNLFARRKDVKDATGTNELHFGFDEHVILVRVESRKLVALTKHWFCKKDLDCFIRGRADAYGHEL